MKMRFSQKALAAAMVVSMVAMPLSVFATDSAAPASTSASTEAAVVATVATNASSGQVTSGGSTASETPSPSVVALPSDGKVAANGTTIYSTAAGISTVKSVGAVAITAAENELSAALSLEPGAKAFSSSYDISPKTAPAAAAAIEGVAESQGCTSFGMFNMNIGSMKGGKFTLADGSVRVRTSLVIPPKADPAWTYSVVVVSPGGATRVEPDQDTNPKTVTYNANGGLGAYGLIGHAN